jgi:hypothetical protein
MFCKVCLKDLDETVNCPECGDTGLCEDCADECVQLDTEQEVTYD